MTDLAHSYRIEAPGECGLAPRLPRHPRGTARERVECAIMSPANPPPVPDMASLARGIRAGERGVIARAITLAESRRADHQKAARGLVQELLPATGKAAHVSPTGPP